MNVHCWNCGQDREVSEAEVRDAERARLADVLEARARLFAETGFPIRYEIYTDAARTVRASTTHP